MWLKTTVTSMCDTLYQKFIKIYKEDWLQASEELNSAAHSSCDSPTFCLLSSTQKKLITNPVSNWTGNTWIVNGDQLHLWRPTSSHYYLQSTAGDSKRHSLERTAKTFKSRKKLIVPSWSQKQLRCYWHEKSHTQKPVTPQNFKGLLKFL